MEHYKSISGNCFVHVSLGCSRQRRAADARAELWPTGPPSQMPLLTNFCPRSRSRPTRPHCGHSAQQAEPGRGWRV